MFYFQVVVAFKGVNHLLFTVSVFDGSLVHGTQSKHKYSIIRNTDKIFRTLDDKIADALLPELVTIEFEY